MFVIETRDDFDMFMNEFEAERESDISDNMDEFDLAAEL